MKIYQPTAWVVLVLAAVLPDAVQEQQVLVQALVMDRWYELVLGPSTLLDDHHGTIHMGS